MEIYIVTMKSGPNTFTALVLALDLAGAKEIAEIRFEHTHAKAIAVRRAIHDVD